MTIIEENSKQQIIFYDNIIISFVIKQKIKFYFINKKLNDKTKVSRKIRNLKIKKINRRNEKLIKIIKK